MEYIVEEDFFDLGDVDDNPFIQDGGQQWEQEDESEDISGMGSPNMDTSVAEFRKGKDMQGIPWERMNSPRVKYREMRVKQYKNYQSLPQYPGRLEKECNKVDKGSTFYDFQYNTRLVKPTIVHFQLRNLVWATSKHDVFMMENYSVMHWSALQRKSKEVFNVTGQIVPTQKHQGSSALSRVQVCTMAMKDNLLVAGGFQGELLCKYLNQPGVAFCTRLASDDSAITNAVEIHETSNGSTRLITANNDCCVRVFDTEKFGLLSRFPFSWSVNCVSVSPDGKLLAVLGDDVDSQIVDSQSGKMIGNLKGHLDYSFVSAWHPEGHILATGNQDKTCRLWDMRNLSESFAVLKGNMGAIRCIKFSSDGRFLAMAEPADFVHIYDSMADYSRAQEIDLFGEVSGITFSPDTEALFVGIADRTYGSLLEFNRRHGYHYLDSFL